MAVASATPYFPKTEEYNYGSHDDIRSGANKTVCERTRKVAVAQRCPTFREVNNCLMAATTQEWHPTNQPTTNPTKPKIAY